MAYNIKAKAENGNIQHFSPLPMIFFQAFFLEVKRLFHSVKGFLFPAAWLLHLSLLTLCADDCYNPLPDGKILDWSKLKQIADNNLQWI